MHPFINGALFGLLVASATGPVFFTLIQTAIQRGMVMAVFFAIGVSLCDLSYLTVSWLGLSEILNDQQGLQLIGFAGGILLIGFGGFGIIRSWQEIKATASVSGKRNPLRQVLKGMLINGSNPLVLLFWASVVGYVSLNFRYTQNQFLLFVAGIQITIFSTDMAKAFLSTRIKHLFTTYRIKILNRIIGIILVLFGVRLLYYALTNSFPV